MRDMTQKELLEQAKEVDWLREMKELPIFTGIYIIQQKKLHESGYRLMYVIGHTKDFEYYLLDSVSDVVSLTSYWSKIPLEDLHVDINKHGIIHLWTNSKGLKCTFAISSCDFDVVEMK